MINHLSFQFQHLLPANDWSDSSQRRRHHHRGKCDCRHLTENDDDNDDDDNNDDDDDDKNLKLSSSTCSKVLETFLYNSNFSRREK